jgi:hypothetical protein
VLVLLSGTSPSACGGGGGGGPAPRSLQVQLITFQVNGTLKTGQSVTVELGIDAPATHGWYLQHHGAGKDGVLVSRAVSFTPIEPGQYRLVQKVEGVRPQPAVSLNGPVEARMKSQRV